MTLTVIFVRELHPYMGFWYWQCCQADSSNHKASEDQQDECKVEVVDLSYQGGP